MQNFMVTVTLQGAPRRRYRKTQSIAAPAQSVLFTKMPLGRYRIDVTNKSEIPCYPDAIAEVEIKAHHVSYKLVVILSTDTLREIADKCQFRVGAFNGNALGDLYSTEFNADVLASFWNTSHKRRVKVQEGNVALLEESNVKLEPIKPDSSSFGLDAAPLNVGLKTPSLDRLPGPLATLPKNLLAIRDESTYRPIPSPGGATKNNEVYGLLQAAGDGNRQITFVRVRADEQDLEVVPAEHVKDKTVRFYAFRPGLEAIQFTPLVWKATTGAPPPGDPAQLGKGKELIRSIEGYVRETVGIHRNEPSKEHQYVTVNESLRSTIQVAALRKLVKNPPRKEETLIRALAKSVRRNKKLLRPWLDHNPKKPKKPNNVWIRRIDKPDLDYIVSSFNAASAMDPRAALILNDYGVEGIRDGKSIALAVLSNRLRQQLQRTKVGQRAARKLAIGFQMHLNPKKFHLDKKGEMPFIGRLARAVAQVTRSNRMRLFVTEMAIRLDGLEEFSALREQTGYQYSIRNFLRNRIGVNAQSPTVQSCTALTLLELEVANTLFKAAGIEHTEVSSAGSNIVFNGLALHAWVEVRSLPNNITPLRAWVLSEQPKKPKSSKVEDNGKAAALHELLKKLGNNYTNSRTWEQDAEYRLDIEAAFESSKGRAASESPTKLRRQQRIFFEVALTCLAANRCDDLAFWNVLDNPGTDDAYDLLGHLFHPTRGARMKGDKQGVWPARKPAYFGVQQALIEAGLAKGNLHSYKAAQNRSYTIYHSPALARKPKKG